MMRRPPRSTRTDTLCPYTTLFRSQGPGNTDKDWRVESAELLIRLAGDESCVAVPLGRDSVNDEPFPSRVREASILIKCALLANHDLRLSKMSFHRTALVYDRRHYERSEEHTSELQSLMRISYAVFCLKKQKKTYSNKRNTLSPTKLNILNKIE